MEGSHLRNQAGSRIDALVQYANSSKCPRKLAAICSRLLDALSKDAVPEDMQKRAIEGIAPLVLIPDQKLASRMIGFLISLRSKESFRAIWRAVTDSDDKAAIAETIISMTRSNGSDLPFDMANVLGVEFDALLAGFMKKWSGVRVHSGRNVVNRLVPAFTLHVNDMDGFLDLLGSETASHLLRIRYNAPWMDLEDQKDLELAKSMMRGWVFEAKPHAYEPVPYVAIPERLLGSQESLLHKGFILVSDKVHENARQIIAYDAYIKGRILGKV